MELRLLHSQRGKEPELVRNAQKGRITKEQAWKNEALRFWYMVVRRNRNITFNQNKKENESLLVGENGKPLEMPPLMNDVGDTE